MNQVRINVTEEHFRLGKPLDFAYCPLGIALKQNFPYSKIWVGIWTFEIDGKKYDMPQEVVYMNTAFDCKGEVNPLSFDIDL